jgi:ATP synthase protein I
MVQIAFMLPCAGFIGWLAGAWLGKHLHQEWMPMAGILFGIIAGLIGAVRMAIAATAGADSDQGGAKNGEEDPRSRP